MYERQKRKMMHLSTSWVP